MKRAPLGRPPFAVANRWRTWKYSADGNRRQLLQFDGFLLARGEHFGFAVDWMRKDLGLVLDEARANGARLAQTALVDQFYAEVQALGGNRWDTSSLAARLRTPD